MEVKSDKLTMREIILEFPKQFRVGFKAAKDIKIKKRFDGLIICGMGGSALPGAILKILAKNLKINFPFYFHKNYGIPYWANKKFLIICISYSGNTEETLSSFKEAVGKNLPLVVIASGGKLAEEAKKNKIPLSKIPAGFPPRMALGFQFSALIKILSSCRLIKTDVKKILSLENELKPHQSENNGKKLAQRLINKIPLVYSSFHLKDLARIWKIKFNENSKIPSFFNHFPELNHNELVGFSSKRISFRNFHLLMLKDDSDHPRIAKRMELTAEFVKTKGVGVDVVKIKGKNIIFKIFSNILLSDWTSYYLAQNYKVDPVRVEIVEKFKKRLKK